jgi:hypothetical protein
VSSRNRADSTFEDCDSATSGFSAPGFARPEDAVSWLGAVQAQDYAGAKWALGLRMQISSEAIIERAFAEGRILRTHVMRPTWHFVTPADIRWMLALTAPRVQAAMSSYDRKLELDVTVFRQSRNAITRALRGGRQLTREELKAAMQRSGVVCDGLQRLSHLLIRAESDGVICSGARRGTQFTYALLDERVPATPVLQRDEALAELTRRFFTGHGPAQAQDFAWWSGLTVADARAGLSMVESGLTRTTVDGRTYWCSGSRPSGAGSQRDTHLLPLYDEYLIAYKDRSAAIDPPRWTRAADRDPYLAPVVLRGEVLGGWRRELGRNRVIVTIVPFVPFNKTEGGAVAHAARRYAAFLKLDLKLVIGR